MRVTDFSHKLFTTLRRAGRRGRVAAGAAILAGGMAFVGSADAQELVVNGGFETNNGFNADNSGLGWTTVAGTDTALGFDVYSHTTQVYYSGAAPAGAGEWYFHTVGLGLLTTTPAVVEQQIDVTGLDGKPYLFNAYISGFSAPGDTAILELEFDVGGVAQTLDGTTGGADGITDTWDLFKSNGVFPAGATAATVRIHQATATDSNGNDNYVDLVSLQIIPEPSTVALAGTRRHRRYGHQAARLIAVRSTVASQSAPC